MNHWHINRAAAVLQAGGVLLHATEGVWGLACDPFNPGAVRRVLALKRRDPGKGLIVVSHDAADFAAELEGLAERERAAVSASWPGACTWILPSQRFGPWITGGRQSVAARVTAHPQVRALCAAAGFPIVSTSANPSGRPPARNQLKARAYFQQQVDYVLPGATLHCHGPSVIRRANGEVLRGAG